MTWGENWGASLTERGLPLPCDELLPNSLCRLHGAVSVHAPVWLTYRWLCQLSLAPYSYDLIDNRGRRSPAELVPGSDRFSDGQGFMSILFLASHARDQHLTLANRLTAVTYAVRVAPEGSRLLADPD